MPLFSKLGSRLRRAVDARRVYQEQSLERVTSSKSESASHWRPALPPILEDSKGARLPVKKSGEKKKTSSRQVRSVAKSYGRDSYWRSSTMVAMPFFAPMPFMF
ncbi:uncharacterized protein LOC111811838 [Cucurbita pepo subsp. pepo]|uniref:uncharacterized protein LOC111811838 n=1 Tax=Cucurbita pepo subsp. pepo TaxID=3664 RepID=UPI000C9D3CC1|nr:uncharacterized protein LOC111811838 [Cucurbita pepo subsp. pepo]